MPLQKFICLLLILVVFDSFIATDIPAASLPTEQQNAEKTRAVVQQALQKHKTVNVVLKDNRKISGQVTEQTNEGFTISDSKTDQSMPLAFSDVRSIKQKGMNPALKVAIGVGIVCAALVAIACGRGACGD